MLCKSVIVTASLRNEGVVISTAKVCGKSTTLELGRKPSENYLHEMSNSARQSRK